MITERDIRAALDGKFFWFDYARERVGCSLVPFEYLPDYTPAYDEDAIVEAARKGGQTRIKPWTALEDEELIQLREQGWRWQNIGKKLGRGDKSARLRYLEICKQRGIVPHSAIRAQRNMLSTAQKAAIVRMREEENMSFREIDEALGIRNFWARDYYTRYRRDIAMRRNAA